MAPDDMLILWSEWIGMCNKLKMTYNTYKQWFELKIIFAAVT